MHWFTAKVTSWQAACSAALYQLFYDQLIYFYIKTDLEFPHEREHSREENFPFKLEGRYFVQTLVIHGWCYLLCDICLKVIEGNKNTYALVTNYLHPPVITRYVRLLPITKLSTTVCMRVELYGCPWEGRMHKTHIWICVFRNCLDLKACSSSVISTLIISRQCLLLLGNE